MCEELMLFLVPGMLVSCSCKSVRGRGKLGLRPPCWCTRIKTHSFSRTKAEEGSACLVVKGEPEVPADEAQDLRVAQIVIACPVRLASDPRPWRQEAPAKS